jgi:cell division protein FtsL
MFETPLVLTCVLSILIISGVVLYNSYTVFRMTNKITNLERDTNDAIGSLHDSQNGLRLAVATTQARLKHTDASLAATKTDVSNLHIGMAKNDSAVNSVNSHVSMLHSQVMSQPRGSSPAAVTTPTLQTTPLTTTQLSPTLPKTSHPLPTGDESERERESPRKQEHPHVAIPQVATPQSTKHDLREKPVNWQRVYKIVVVVLIAIAACLVFYGLFYFWRRRSQSQTYTNASNTTVSRSLMSIFT